MILKSLWLQGFKSFPDRTEIRFTGGLTAFVGPNGSGKSNISDAIRWVLGEQSSRSLRGAKMEDVIFGGTEKRRPLGFAEVSLILDNAAGIFRSEHLEIMVTRRYYRSGESEYSLNKQPCRLRDIHELFMDTGLGRDGYSIIGQGRIDEILSLKSEDRREIFEEAAGVTKFRYRKEDAERKLSATEDNLVRIRDLYGELENQVAPLAKQAERAKAYLLLRDELRVLEVSLWLGSLERMRADGAKTERDARTCSAHLHTEKDALTAVYAHAEQLAAQMRQAEIRADDLRHTLRTSEEEAGAAQSTYAVLETHIANFEKNIVRVQQESTRQAVRASALGQQQAARRARCSALDEAHAALKESIAQAEAHAAKLQMQDTACEQALAMLEEQLAAQTAAQFQLELAQVSVQTDLGHMDARRETIGTELAAEQSALAAEQITHAEYTQKLDDCRAQHKRMRDARDDARKAAEAQRVDLEAQAAVLTQKESTLRDCENRIRMLRDLQKDSFSRAVKRVMERAEEGLLQGIRAPVASLLTVPRTYITAVEAALGAAASHLVTETAHDAKTAIAFLKSRDGGRATFLPMDTIRPAFLRERDIGQHAGCHGTADTLVQCAEDYRAIVQSLLGRTAVAEDLHTALALAKACQHRFRIVTLDGQIIQAGGAMVGGSVSKTGGALARADALDSLEREQERLREDLAQAAAERKAAQAAFAQAAAAYEEQERRCIRLQEEEARLLAAGTQHQMLLDSLTARCEALAHERDHLAQAEAEYRRTRTQKETALAAVREAVASHTKARDTRRDTAKRIQANRAANAAQIASLRTAAAENRTETAAERRALEDLERVHREMEDSISREMQSLAEFETGIAACQIECAAAREAMRQGAERTDALRAQIHDVMQDRMRLEGEKTAADKRAQAQNEVILGLERENARLLAQIQQYQEQETQLLNKMWESYELTPTPASKIRIPIEAPAKAEQQAGLLREKMRALGNVNLDAVEEYAALLERFTFLGTQKDDLETARHALEKVIAQLTVQMKEVFSSEFAKLNAFFGQTFREIFGGGHARLELADTADVLHCGIDILVCPPGKAVKTITLLSGGEKAFVAIALYFAILKLRPAPFSVLDEIEAALDDVNVGRFAAYVRRLSAHTQFVVITHRRGTMEAADTLYGVTMQEQGVSRLLMLNLAEAERELALQ